jgi:ribonuclease HI
MKAKAWVDGGSRGNPGEAGCGVVLDLAGAREEHFLFLGRATNNVAEYAALLAALERTQAVGATEIEVYSDSELLVKQMTGAYRVKQPHLQRLWLAAQQLARSFQRFTIRHVPRVANSDADRLANRAMDEKSSTLPRPKGLA